MDASGLPQWSFEIEFDEEAAARNRYDPDQLEITRTLVRPTKQKIQVQALVLAWAPMIKAADGSRERAF